MEIKVQPPSWKMVGDLAIDQLKQGHTDYALGVIPMMVEKLVTLEQYANEDGKLSVNKVEGSKKPSYQPSAGRPTAKEVNKAFKENFPTKS
tara:strand:- start:1853 stop:2125 length:273 start_codon:yes stop_codon:yes gene_type:complete